MPHLATLLDRGRIRFPGHTAVGWNGGSLTYAQLNGRVEELARALAAGGVASGRRIAIVAPNAPCLIVALFAAWRVDATPIPLSARYRAYELQRILADAGPDIVISVRDNQGFAFDELFERLAASLPTTRRFLFVSPVGTVERVLENACAGPGPDAAERQPAVGVVLYTSGTTGAPRGALISHSSSLRGAEEMNRRLLATEADVTAFAIPVVHAFGLQCLLAVLLAGGAAALIDGSSAMAATADAIAAAGASVVHGSPVLFSGLLKSGSSCLDPVRTGFVAGARCPEHLVEALDGRGVRILNLYGMTEFGAITSTTPADSDAVRRSTCGRPFPGIEVRLAADGSGEVLARSEGSGPAYLNQSGPAAFESAGPDQGWFPTGDLGALDAEGNLSISGRSKDLVKVGGFSVFPQEVEAALLLHEDVSQAVVTRAENADLEESLRAFVVLRPGSGTSTGDLLRFLRSRIAGYKLPYAMQVLPELPLLGSGKPDRIALSRLQLEERSAVR